MRVLVVSPHFPPDASAAAHRARVVGPYLERAGWTPTILTVDPRDLDGTPDDALAARLPETLDVRRVRAWPLARARRFGFGDLGLRAYRALAHAGDHVLAGGAYAAAVVTIYPTYPALLLPRWRRRFGVAAVLDYQDPWVGAWGQSVGPAPGGHPDARARWSRRVATLLEPRVVSHLDAAMAVSHRTLAEVAARTPALHRVPWLELPIGCDPDDAAAATRAAPVGFTPGDGLRHVVYVGTLLPRAQDAMRAVLDGFARWRATDPSAHDVRLHCIGTSNQSGGTPDAQVAPLAHACGVADVVTEHPRRVPFAQAMATLAHADGVLVVGSDEPHYTASKLYPALLADRPLLALLHPESQAAQVVAGASPEAALRLLATSPHAPSAAQTAEAWRALLRAPRGPAGLAALATPFLGPALAERLAALLTAAVARRTATRGAA